MADKICPLIGGACLRDGCMWWAHVTGKTPQENKQVDLHDCAVAWIPALILETTKSVRASQDTVEAFRSETRQGFGAFMGLAVRAAARPPVPGNGSTALPGDRRPD